MTVNTRQAKPVNLSCGCKRYYTVYPNISEELWCPTHQEYVKVGNPDALTSRVYEEDFWSEPISQRKVRRFRGGCTYEGCGYETRTPFDNWHRLRDHMHKHYISEHTQFATNLVITEVDRNVRSEPPF